MQIRKAILADLIHFSMSKDDAVRRMEELEELTRTYGGVAVVKTIQRRAKPDYRTFIGKGKVDELVAEAKTLGVTLLVVNEMLKPQQLYNLEEAFRGVGVAVWDRIDLILNIFDKHATSREAKLEIDLARIRHMGPRIFHMSGELGRQRGGTGTRGGAGEGNTEAMKRHLRAQEETILKKLKTCEGVRAEQLRHRERVGAKTVALVGYTNAGKTSLLNALTKRREYAANALFATLDTRTGECFLPDLGEAVLLSDTIGFIDGLPPELIAAFHATLAEAMHADVLLIVVDASDKEYAKKLRVVEGILTNLQPTAKERIIVWNKIDRMKGKGKKEGACVSALTGEGLDGLRAKIAQAFL